MKFVLSLADALPMSTDPRTIGWLSRALTHELGAVQQYLAQGVLARLWGDDGLAQSLEKNAQDELRHAQVLMEHLIYAGVAPAAGQLAPARLGRTASDFTQSNRLLETQAVHLYQQALAHAQRVRDDARAAVFEGLLQEELEHLHVINAQTPQSGGSLEKNHD